MAHKVLYSKNIELILEGEKIIKHRMQCNTMMIEKLTIVPKSLMIIFDTQHDFSKMMSR